jgi:hypothetical protein
MGNYQLLKKVPHTVTYSERNMSATVGLYSGYGCKGASGLSWLLTMPFSVPLRACVTEHPNFSEKKVFLGLPTNMRDLI